MTGVSVAEAGAAWASRDMEETSHQVQQLPAEGSTGTTTDEDLEQLQRLANMVAQRHDYGPRDEPVTKQLNFQVAMYLQEHPRRELSLSEIAQGTGLTVTQVSSVTQVFVKERTDVERPRHGVLVYTPGKGPGIKPKLGRDEVPVVKSKGKEMAQRAIAKAADKRAAREAKPPGLVPSPGDPGVLVKQPEMFYEVPDLHTRDGRRIIRGWDGIGYVIEELG